eukprot:sb/3475587/
MCHVLTGAAGCSSERRANNPNIPPPPLDVPHQMDWTCTTGYGRSTGVQQMPPGPAQYQNPPVHLPSPPTNVTGAIYPPYRQLKRLNLPSPPSRKVTLAAVVVVWFSILERQERWVCGTEVTITEF